MKKITALLLSCIFVLGLFTGCGEKTQTKSEGSSEATSDTTPAAVSDTLMWNLGSDPKTWDPTINSAANGGHLINNIFEGLMKDVGAGKLEYALAESHEVSEDNLTYTFHLRPDLKWSDGKPLTAGDIEYSWKRVCDPKTASDYSFIMAPYIVGAEAFLNGEGSKDEMGVKALDDKTLEVKLNFPVPYFLNLTTFYTYLPVREDVAEKGDGWEKNVETCITSGPFKVVEYKIGDHVSLEKNENYWDAANVQLKKIKVTMVEEASTAFAAYQNGDLHIVNGGQIPANEIANLMATDPNFSVVDEVGNYFINFNCDVAPFNDLKVRKAFTLAIDRKMIVDQVAKGGQKPATGFMPPLLKYSDGTSVRKLDENGMPAPEFGIDPNRAQVEEAQALLAEAGYPNGEGFPTVTYKYSTSESHKAIAEALQEMWKNNLNVNVQIANEEFATFTGTRSRGDYEICRGGWYGDYNDPMTFLDLYTSYSGNNGCQWRWKENEIVAPHDKTLNPENKEFDDAIEKINHTVGTERDEWIRTAEKILMDNCINCSLYYHTGYQVIDESKVEGVAIATMGQFIFKYAKMVG